MENKEVKKARTRKGSRAESSFTSTEEEMAPNMNGDKDGGSETENATNAPKEAGEDNEQKLQTSDVSEDTESLAKGTKRKLSELQEEEIVKDLDPPTKENDESSEVSKNDSMEVEDSTKENILNEEDEAGESLIGNDTLNTTSEMVSLTDKLEPINQQSLGKGKRARVPNKRYSDIPSKRLSDNAKTKLSENGQVVENEIDKQEPEADVEDEPTKRPPYSSPVPHTTKKLKSVDLSNPCFLKPFKLGWKRELVYRSTSDNSLKRNGDIYYYTPNGKKVRSMREVSDNLSKELSLDDFTFCKEPLGIADPEKEIIRAAKIKASAAAVAKKPTPKVQKPPARTRTRSPKASLILSPVTGDSTKSVKSPKRSGGAFKVKVPKTTPNRRAKKTPSSNMEIGTYPPNWTSPTRKGKSPSFTETDSKPCQPCSIRCPDVSGLVPTLQCRICLCLYHYECVGVSVYTKTEGYICKNCQLEHDTNADVQSHINSPPPLTPLNLLNNTDPVQNDSLISPTQPNNLPKLQRIPKSSENTNTQISDHLPLELPKLTPKPGLKQNYVEQKGILGGVTTWFPPSSTINVGNEIIENNRTCRPQSVEYVGNKKYLIVSRHNILSLAPVTPNIPTELPENKTESHSSLVEVDNTPISNINSNPDELVSNNDPTLEEPVLHESISKLNTSPDELIPNINTDRDETISIKNTSVDELSSNKNNSSDKPVCNRNTNPDEPIFCNNPDAPIFNTNPDEPKSPCNNDQHQESKEDPQQSPVEESEKTLTGKGKPATKASKQHSVTETTVEVSKITDSYLQNLAYGYQTLLHVFQYLKVQDLLRAGCVCTMWSDVARHPILWNTVRMKNSQIHSFEGLANALLKHGTVHLDLRKMLLPTTGGDDIWPSFTTAIKKVESLRKIELCRCLAAVVEDLARNNHNLEAINAVTIKCESMTFEPFSNLKNLTDLRLKSTTGLSLTSDLSALKELTKLKHLSITSIKDLYQLNIEVIADLVNIEVLDLGECSEFPKHFGPDILSKLVKLEKLRLEKGQGECYTFDILNAVKDIKTLTQLELVNFDIKTGFDKALGSCVNIKKLLMIPTYISQSATTNHMVLGGVLKLQKTLSHFVWGVTLELLRVTELFVDQCEQPDKREVSKDKNITSGDSIPVLKPVPLHGMPQSQVFMGNTDTPQVEILPLPNLQKLLLQNLPSTRVKILKIPFHATWRQTITDSV